MRHIGSSKAHPFQTAGRIALILSLLLCTWLTGGAVAWGWIAHAGHYGDIFRLAGIAVFALNTGMTAAVLLHLLRHDLAAAVLGTVCGTALLLIAVLAVSAAERNGWSGQTEASFGRSAAAVWRRGLSGNLLTLLLLLLLTLTRFFSADAAAERAERRRNRLQQEQTAVPSILSDGTRGNS